MRLLSIDVGMRYLAYCLMLCPDEGDWSLEQWATIDLCQEAKLKCCSRDSKGDPCRRKTKYRKGELAYCRVHARNKSYKIPSASLSPKALKKLSLYDLKTLCTSFGLVAVTKVKKAVYMRMVKDHISAAYFEQIDHVNAKDIKLTTYGRQLKIKFEERLKDVQIDRVIVEQQVGPLALRMKMLQGMIMQHFIERKCPVVEEIAPVNKLKAFLGENHRLSYRARKKLGVERVGIILSEKAILAVWADLFHKHRKKDDLADCFLQAIWYIANFNK